MRIELLYFDDCPSYQDARATLEQILAEESITAQIEMVRVVDDDDAQAKQFVGSPTLRMNGADLFPEQLSGVFAMQCRVYRTSQGFKGTPSKEMLRDALRQNISPVSPNRGAE